MQYAIIGDIHSSKSDLEKVLKEISIKAPEAKIIGTGDLFECTVSKKDIGKGKYHELERVMIIPEHFLQLLDFPSVRGNQEERILLITEMDEPLLKKIASIPETLRIGEAEVIHGHQWKWGGNPWQLQEALTNHRLVFYGHSHESMLTIDGVRQVVEFEVPYLLNGGQILVNVGAVVNHCEWVLYDEDQNIVTFMKVEEN